MEEPEFQPPYLAFGTFRNFITGLNPQRVPARIDRSLMIGMAGGTQTYLLQALRQFGLIDMDGRVSRQLAEMAAGEDAFKAGLRSIVRTHYADQLALSEGEGTAGQLAESFAASGYQGSTVRKAVTFFLNAAAAADIPLSSHFRSPTAGRGAPTRRKPRSKPTTLPVPPGPQPGAGAVETKTVDLVSGGNLTLTCSTSFFQLSREDREFVFGLRDQLDDYAERRTAAPQTPSAASKENREDQ